MCMAHAYSRLCREIENLFVVLYAVHSSLTKSASVTNVLYFIGDALVTVTSTQEERVKGVETPFSINGSICRYDRLSKLMSAEQTKFAVTRAGSGKGRVAVFVKRK